MPSTRYKVKVQGQGTKYRNWPFLRTGWLGDIGLSAKLPLAERRYPQFSGHLERYFTTASALHSRDTVDRSDPNGVDERSFRFLVDVLGFVDTIQKGPKTNRLIEQLVDSAGSIGANREEALGASSRKEFIRFNEIALRSANESVRWLRACAAKQLGSQELCVALLDEARQLARILGRIVVTSKTRTDT